MYTHLNNIGRYLSVTWVNQPFVIFFSKVSETTLLTVRKTAFRDRMNVMSFLSQPEELIPQAGLKQTNLRRHTS
jgi:hypothetical protein